MPQISDFPVRGRITAAEGGRVTFHPLNTNYQFHLTVPADFSAPLGVLIDGLVKVAAKKVYAVPSGGNFVSPIFGPPKTIQGWVKYADARQIVVQAGAPIVVDLPAEDDALDLQDGGIGVGSLVNVVALPGASFELVSASVAR